MFDRYVVARTQVSWGRRALIIASVFLHVGAGVGLMIWSFFHVEEIVPPAMSLTVFSAPPPPPPPPPPAAHHKTPEHVTPKVIPHEIVQPTSVQKIVQPKEEEKKPEPDEKDEPDGEEGGEEGGVAGGVKGGVKGGVVGGQLGGQIGGNGTDVKAPVVTPRTVAGFTLLAQQISHPDPHLPQSVMAARPHQDVKGMYKVCIRNDGRIMDVIPMTPIAGADSAIAEQIKASWVYKPQPVPICFVAALTFKVP
jgi:periplasmic protein TonB